MKPTQEQVLQWAREAGWQYAEDDNDGYDPLWKAMRLAYEAGRKDENEACAQIAAYLLKLPENDISAMMRRRMGQ